MLKDVAGDDYPSAEVGCGDPYMYSLIDDSYGKIGSRDRHQSDTAVLVYMRIICFHGPLDTDWMIDNISCRVPSNVKFQIDDIEEPWTYSRPFDLIHCR